MEKKDRNWRVKNNGRHLLVVGILFIFIAGGSLKFRPQLSDASEIMEPKSAIALTQTIIQGNANLTTFLGTLPEFSGTGIESDPYFVSDLVFNDASGMVGNYLFEIRDTDLHIVFNNLRFEDITVDLSYFGLVGVANCANIHFQGGTVENISNEEAIDGDISIFYCYNSENITISSVNVADITAGDLKVFGGFNLVSLRIEDCTVSDLAARKEFQGIHFSGSDQILCQKNKFERIAITGSDFAYLIYLGVCTESEILNNEYRHINHEYSLLLSRLSESSTILLKNNIYENLTGSYLYNTLTDTNDCEYNGNRYSDLVSENNLDLFFMAGTNTNNCFISNLIFSIKASDLTIFSFSPGENSYNVIKNNVLGGNVIASNPIFVRFGSNCDFNDCYRNIILNGTGYLALDHGTYNQFSVLDYFEPYAAMILVGNYWCDHNFDSEPGFHYFVNTPRPIYGNANNSDYFPLHYYAMDFDNDGFLNYDEIQAGTSPNDADSDGDGINDAEDSNPLNEKTPFPWDEFYRNPTNLLLGAVGMLLILNMIPFKRKSKKRAE